MATVINDVVYIPALNGTLIPRADCTNDICPLEYAQVGYIPTFAGNLVYLIIFALVLVAQLGLGIRYKTWGFLVGMMCGILLEVIGYVGRLLLNHDDFEFNYFIIYLVCLTIGPAFLSACIYLCLSRLIVIYGRSIARFAPKVYTIVFICCDIISLVLQAAGGAIAATSTAGTSGVDTGTNIMVAGLAFQVASMALFIILALDFAWAAKKAEYSQLNDAFVSVRETRLFKLFPWAMAIATLTIFVRCCFRVAELQGGFGSDLANDEVTFMILEGPMIIIAVVALTVLHPGFCLGGKDAWKTAALSSGKEAAGGRSKDSEIEMGTPDYYPSSSQGQQGYQENQGYRGNQQY